MADQDLINLNSAITSKLDSCKNTAEKQLMAYAINSLWARRFGEDLTFFEAEGSIDVEFDYIIPSYFFDDLDENDMAQIAELTQKIIAISNYDLMEAFDKCMRQFAGFNR